MHKIWFPQIDLDGSQDNEDIVVEALRKFYELFGLSNREVFVAKKPLAAFHHTVQGITPDIFNISALLKFLEERKRLWAFGTFSFAQIAECSIHELGFNLFSLPGKIFNYVPLICSSENEFKCIEDLLLLSREFIEKEMCQHAVELLKLSRCHQAALEIQKIYGHGLGQSQRDWLQVHSCRDIFNRLNNLKNNREKEWTDLCCGGECQLLQEMNEILDILQSAQNEDKPCPELSRKIAFFDCQKYRMAQSKYFANLDKSTRTKKDEKFKKIIILEDNQKFREQLKTDLRQYVKKVKDIIEADPKKSWQNYCLSKKKRNDILDKILKDETIGHGEILICFDLDLGKENIPQTAVGNMMKNIFGGQWILYKTSCVYPQIPKLVITGYRSQDLSSHIAGGSAFLVKPYTTVLLENQIKKARRWVRRRVTWLCPEGVQRDYNKLFAPEILSFREIKESLINWLDRKQVDLEIVENDENIEDKELVIIDIFEIELEVGNTPGIIMKLKEIISKIRAKNPGVQFIMVLPFELDRETLVSDYYKQLPLNFHDGTDHVIRKPFWFVLDKKTKQDECLGNMILEQLDYKGNYDVKYQVLVPLAPVVGRLAARVEDMLKKPRGKAIQELYAPLLPYLINVFGFSARIPDLENLGDDVKKKLLKKINEERSNDKDRWKHVPYPDKSISKILDDFLTKLKSRRLKKYITLESWLRHIVDNKPARIFIRKDIHSLTEPLARVFGGSTRYEFSVRGSWYKGSKRIDDILIVVEFCAKSSIILRKFIRETAVKYLSTVAGEDIVLVQEIPIKGFMWE